MGVGVHVLADDAVRLRGGEGDGPQCSAADIVASKNAGQTLLNTWIEFSNRLLNFPLVIIAGLIFVAAWQYRPDGKRRRRPGVAGGELNRLAWWRRRSSAGSSC